ncbi:hypothetical protein WT01_15870 [Burkholderia cepacia]|uniref:hypothetical protein n=1 Tax=Burkholderia cepacia TaxID=292 RepID=UPI000754D8C5|nr:hypothetical protein [Burkholderia cepacia]KVL59303.1 hypothetical protein WT01_15870 [Burkholderia cepacia]
MSTRTLIEINHDVLHRLRERPDLLSEILTELGGCVHNAALNEANERGRALDIGHGIRLVMQYHHTSEISVTTDFAAVRL